MGSHLSFLVAEVFMDYFEKKNPFTSRIIRCYCYADHIFCKGTKREITHFLLFLNSLNPNVTFTLESEIDDSLIFLDVTIKKVSYKLQFRIYRKATRINTFTSHNLKQSFNIVMPVFHSMVQLSKTDYIKVQTIKTIAANKQITLLSVTN